MATEPRSKRHCQPQLPVGDHLHQNPHLTQEEELHFSTMRLKQQKWAFDCQGTEQYNGNSVIYLGGIFGGDGGMQAHANGS